MSRRIISPAAGQRLAIVALDSQGREVRLAVPPFRQDIPREARVRIFEYVLRRQIGLAQAVVDIETELLESRERAGSRIARIMSSRPYVAELTLEDAA